MAEARVSVSFRLPKSLVERVRRVARDYAGKPAFLTVGTLVQAAIERELTKYEGREPDQALVEPPLVRRVGPIGTIRRRNLNDVDKR